MTTKAQERRLRKVARVAEYQQLINECVQMSLETDSDKVKKDLLELAKGYAESMAEVLSNLERTV